MEDDDQNGGWSVFWFIVAMLLVLVVGVSFLLMAYAGFTAD